MRSKKGKTVRSALQLAKSSAVIALLFLYVLGSSNIESFHNLFHGKEAKTLHTELNEADPCHVSVFHQERDSDKCHHSAHLIKEDKCSLCFVQWHPAQLAEVSVITPLTVFWSVSFSNTLDQCTEGINFPSPGRAPPVS